MLRMNRHMATKIQNLDRVETLPFELANIVEQGFQQREDLVFLTAMGNIETNASPNDFPDKTGHECFINSIHIDDYVGSQYLVNALLFVELCFAKWKSSGMVGELRAIVCSDEFGVVVKIHRVRNDETWIDADLEGYEDAILVTDSNGWSQPVGM